MSLFTLLWRSLAFHTRSNLAVFLGVVVGTAVLAGALVVGDSLRGSLRDLTLERLGKVDAVVVTDRFFRANLAERFRRATEAPIVAPVIILRGTVLHAGQPLGTAQVVGIDESFWPLFNVPPADLDDELWINTGLARSLVHEGDLLEIRIGKPPTMPSDALLGRPVEDPAITIEQSKVGRILPNKGAGGFTLDAMQQQPRTVYVQLRRLQQRLRDSMGMNDSANALFMQLPPGADVTKLQETLNREAELEDLALRLLPDANGQRYLALESRRMLIEPEVVDKVRELAQQKGWKYEPTLTYLANKITAGDKFVPYSTVTGLDPTAQPPWGPLQLVAVEAAPALKDDEILVNEWAAKDLGVDNASAKDAEIKLSYFVESDGWLLKEETTSFKLAGVVALKGPANDRSLTPELPGMRATSIRDWTPPFPKEQWHPEWVKERDEQYWRRYRATPKAFVTPATAQRLWHSRYGNYTALRLAPASGQDLKALETTLRQELRDKLPADQLGLKMRDVKNQGLAASGSHTAQTFGFLFLSFSFFLIVSAMLLVGLLFRLGMEQRAHELGVLFAAGFRQRIVRRLLLAEGALVAGLGGMVGLGFALVYAIALVYFLRIYWRPSLNVSFLQLHVAAQDPMFGPMPYPSLLIGFTLSFVIALATIYWSTRVLGRLSPRALLSGQFQENRLRPYRTRRTGFLAGLLVVFALFLAIISFFVPRSSAPLLFFGSGACLLVAGLALAAWWLRDRQTQVVKGHGMGAVAWLGASNCQRNRGRSLLTAGLIASATFLIIAVEAFRQSDSAAQAGTGSFPLMSEADVPLYQPPNTPELRAALWPDATPPELNQLVGATFYGFRVRPGDDVSCLNLYQPQQPRTLGVPKAIQERDGFAFGSLLSPTAEEKANPWRLLDRPTHAIPILLDGNTAEWIMQKSIGDEWSITDEQGREVMVQLVGVLQGSIFQSELLMSEDRFRELYPSRGGYAYFLIDLPADHAHAIQQALEGPLQGRYGMAVSRTADRLAEYHAVENTYLSTFQVLGGLGLLLGTLGLAVVLLRNVWERRGELALLQALGYRARDVGWLVFAENGFLVLLGLIIGSIAAFVAVLPHVLERSGGLPWSGMGALLLLVLVAGLVAGLLAVRSTLRLPLLPALRRE